MFLMQVPAHPLSPRDAILALLLAAMPLTTATSGSVTANATTLALGEQVSDTLQLGQSGVAIVLPEGDWRISGLVRPRQIGAPYALAVLTRSEGQALAGTVWVRAVGEARFETSAMSGLGPPHSHPRIFSLTGGRHSAAYGERGYTCPGR